MSVAMGDNDFEAMGLMHLLADTLGYVATLAFFLQYVPQIGLNYKRKSCKGKTRQAVSAGLLPGTARHVVS